MTTAAMSRLAAWRYLVLFLCLAPLWVVALEGWIKPTEIMMASADPSRRLTWWLLPPLILVLAALGGRWLYLSAQARAEERNLVAAQADQERQKNTVEAQAAAALAREQETLEVLGLGLVVEKFRNAQVWEAIERVRGEPFQSILPKEAEVLKGELIRGQRSGKREQDAFEYAMRYFIEKMPMPGIVISPKPTTKNPEYLDAGAGTLMGSRDPLTLFVTADQIYADDPDEALGKIFDFFDTHPDVPAAFVFSGDGYITRKFFRGYSPDDINGDPGWKPGDLTEALAALVLVRRDRVDKLIRPYVVDERYGLDPDEKGSYVNLQWNFFFELKHRHEDSALPTAAEWQSEAPKLIESGQRLSADSWTPYWERDRLKGFKPSPWIPVPWAKWQLEQFDALPTLGYLHRPKYAPYRHDGQTLSEKGKAEAFAAAWKSALATLPEGQAPQRLFFDAGSGAHRGRGLIPMSRGFAEHFPDQDWIGTPKAVDLSARLGDTGAASPFTQIALALIASYRERGASATVNLRREDGASVLMVSPPKEPADKRKTHPGAGKDPFKVPLMPEFVQ